MVFQGDVAMQETQPDGQLWNKCDGEPNCSKSENEYKSDFKKYCKSEVEKYTEIQIRGAFVLTKENMFGNFFSLPINLFRLN